jgi:TPR repeat protein
MRRSLELPLFAATILASTAACGPTLPPGPTTPTTAAEATGRVSVVPVAGPTVPFIVDWKAEDRGDLEEAIADGVAVVAFDAQGLRLLKRCHLKGDYGYLPLEPKQDVVRFDSARDVQANLPVGGAGLVAKIGGGFAAGKTLDLAYVMIGKRRTTWTDPTSEDLDGKCEGATHYVRAMTIGAFAMTTGSRQKAHAAAEVFAVSAGGSTSTSSEVATTDGNLTACMGANADSEKPPAGCRSLLRLELEPIVRGDGAKARPAVTAAPAEDKPKARVEARRAIDCGPGMAFVDGKCTAGAAAAEAPRFCDPKSFADCDAQCQRGDAPSCDQAGYLMATGAAGPVDDARANALFEKACNADVMNACVNLGLRQLLGTSAKMASARGLLPLDRACKSGEARGCSIVGDALFVGLAGVPKDPPRALKYYARGCDGGDTGACTNLGVLYLGAGGADVPIDRRKALELSTRACFGGDSTACGNTGLMYEFGMGVPQDITKAQALFKRSCGLDGADCLRLGILYQHGTGFPRNDGLASSLLERSCAEVGRAGTGGFPSLACHVQEKVYGKPARKLDARALDLTVDVMRPQCEQKVARACSFQAVASSALGQPGEVGKLLERGCSLGDPWACDLAKRMKR